ncbi:MAG: tetraacyldisaccharide 4'-kinase [Candidatus Omnitrophica bacterium]|nr:tetraacyldisaccharide 4'-kinase [Candidatus Omnitrophota bacterium]
MILQIKKWYLRFLEKDKKKGGDLFFHCLFFSLSLLYSCIVSLRNFFYDTGIFKAFTSPKKVISLGNISWAGSGKTTLTIWLYKKVSKKIKTAILRRGYGDDEGKLLNQTTKDVYSNINRASLAKDLASEFDLFILDDGFQHRKLNRDLNIVVMGAREFRSNFTLIPANIFREPLNSLKRAQIVIINYINELKNPDKTKEFLLNKFRHLKIFSARYTVKKITDLHNNEYTLPDLMMRRFGAITAIGYPQGFFNTLKSLNLTILKEISYPDHYKLTDSEFSTLRESLHKEQIHDIIITTKDKYHLPEEISGINIYILEVDMVIENEDAFLREIEKIII